MTVLINPGSDLNEPDPEAAWSNTYEVAEQLAASWYLKMAEEGLTDIVMSPPASKEPVEGRWTFSFRHTVTGTVCTLETHGIAPLEAYLKDRIFNPRVYWNDSSSGTPELMDWVAEGFKAVQTFRKV